MKHGNYLHVYHASVLGAGQSNSRRHASTKNRKRISRQLSVVSFHVPSFTCQSVALKKGVNLLRVVPLKSSFFLTFCMFGSDFRALAFNLV